MAIFGLLHVMPISQHDLKMWQANVCFVNRKEIIMPQQGKHILFVICQHEGRIRTQRQNNRSIDRA